MAQDFAYRIPKFFDRHTSGESRRRHGQVIELPTDTRSEGLIVLSETAEGRSAFTTYVLLAELAGTLPAAIKGTDQQGVDTGEACRKLAGVLFDRRGPYCPIRLSRVLPLTADVIADSLGILESPDVGWIDRVSVDDLNSWLASGEPPGDPRGISDDSPPHAYARPAAGASQPASPEGVQGEPSPLLVALRVPPKLAGPAVRSASTATLLAHWGEVVTDKSVKRPGSVVAHRILAGDESPALTAAVVVAAVDAKLITTARLNGSTPIALADRKLTHNRAGLYVDAKPGDAPAIPTEDLERAEYAP